jgi:uncharacterized 2Fe-2S/4Fe-4S cluster protein (DUF4445 family)
MKKDHVILGIHITDRLRSAAEVQKVFTDYGGNIKTRLGLHEVAESACAAEGVVLLEVIGGDQVRAGMMAKLGAIEGIEVKEMVFSHV